MKPNEPQTTIRYIAFCLLLLSMLAGTAYLVTYASWNAWWFVPAVVIALMATPPSPYTCERKHFDDYPGYY